MFVYQRVVICEADIARLCPSWIKEQKRESFNVIDSNKSDCIISDREMPSNCWSRHRISQNPVVNYVPQSFMAWMNSDAWHGKYIYIYNIHESSSISTNHWSPQYPLSTVPKRNGVFNVVTRGCMLVGDSGGWYHYLGQDPFTNHTLW